MRYRVRRQIVGEHFGPNRNSVSGSMVGNRVVLQPGVEVQLDGRKGEAGESHIVFPWGEALYFTQREEFLNSVDELVEPVMYKGRLIRASPKPLENGWSDEFGIETHSGDRVNHQTILSSDRVYPDRGSAIEAAIARGKREIDEGS